MRRWLDCVILMCLGITLHGLSVLILGTAYLGKWLGITGILWVIGGLALTSLFMVPQISKYLHWYRRTGQDAEVRIEFLLKSFTLFVSWPIILGWLAWDCLNEWREDLSGSLDDCDDDFDDELDEPDERDSGDSYFSTK